MSLPLGRLVTLRQERACHQPINKAASVSPSICVYLSGLEFPVEEMSSSPSIKHQALEGGLASLPPSLLSFCTFGSVSVQPFLEEASLSLNTGSRRFLGPGGEGMPPGMGDLESLPSLSTGAQPP